MHSDNRRPLKIRSLGALKKAAEFLACKGLTPNQLSVLSILFSALSAVYLYKATAFDICAYFYLAASLLMMFGRGFCNVIDGMMAIECSKASKSGGLFNEVPDRISDVLILVIAGYAALSPELGFIAGILALMCAYIRALANSLGAPADFSGPMSKAPRMLLLMASAMIAVILEDIFYLKSGLALIIIGTLLTILRRSYSAYSALERR
jgi:phosphatidylglycerophosphate synthase